MGLANRLLIGVMTLMVAGCSFGGVPERSSVESVSQTGFLQDYSVLQPAVSGDSTYLQNIATLSWQNPRAQFPRYEKVIVDPVALYMGNMDEYSEEEIAQMQRLGRYFLALLRNHLGREIRLTDENEPRTLRIQTALVNPENPNATMSVVSTIIPQARLISEIKEGITGRAASVGAAQLEVKVTDAISGEPLLAAVDVRHGSKGISTMGDDWADVQRILDWWAQLARFRLCVLRHEGVIDQCKVPEV